MSDDVRTKLPKYTTTLSTLFFGCKLFPKKYKLLIFNFKQKRKKIPFLTDSDSFVDRGQFGGLFSMWAYSVSSLDSLSFESGIYSLPEEQKGSPESLFYDSINESTLCLSFYSEFFSNFSILACLLNFSSFCSVIP